MTEFKVGDKVRAPTLDHVVGEITNLRSIHGVEKLIVNFDGRMQVFFTDGRYYRNAKEPALILVERPKAKRKVKVERWVNIYKSPSTSSGVSCGMCYFDSDASLNAASNSDFIKTVKFETEVEIEE